MHSVSFVEVNRSLERLATMNDGIILFHKTSKISRTLMLFVVCCDETLRQQSGVKGNVQNYCVCPHKLECFKSIKRISKSGNGLPILIGDSSGVRLYQVANS